MEGREAVAPDMELFWAWISAIVIIVLWAHMWPIARGFWHCCKAGYILCKVWEANKELYKGRTLAEKIQIMNLTVKMELTRLKGLEK